MPTGDVWKDEKIEIQEPLEVKAYQKEEDKSYIGTLVEINTSIRRFRAATPQSSNYIALLREQEDNSFPLVVVPYGGGYLLYAGMYLAGNDSIEFAIIIKAIKDVIDNEFRKF